MAPITRRWLVLAGSLAPVSLAAAQTIVFGDVHDHMRNFQSAVLWDVNNDGKKELVIGGSHEVPAAVYDPDHISDGPLNMNFQFMDSAFGAAATPSGRLFKVGQSPMISLYNSFTTAAANLDNGTSTGLAFFEGTPWGDIAIVSGLRNNVPYLVAEFFGGMNHNAELFAIPIVVEGERYIASDLFGYREGDTYMLDITGYAQAMDHVSLGTDLAHPTLSFLGREEYGGLSGGMVTGLVRENGRYYATTVDQVGSASIWHCPADFDQNGFVNALDYDAFAELFEMGDRGADFDGNGFVNALDYDAFAEHFEAGC